MKYSRQLRERGYIATAMKQGRKQKDRDVTETNRVKDICLNCTEEKCSDRCYKFNKIKRKIKK
jgi:hypothetical protein